MKIINDDAHNVPAASISSTPPLICPMKISDMRKIICVNTVEKNCENEKGGGGGGGGGVRLERKGQCQRNALHSKQGKNWTTHNGDHEL